MNHFKTSLIFILLSLNTFYINHILVEIKTNDLFEIYFLNIGQGDSILIKTPENTYGLIDTGKDGDALLREISKVNKNIKEFEFILITHPDSDHAEGLIKILDFYKVNNLFINKVNKSSSAYEEIKALIKNKNIKNYPLYELTDFTLDNIGFNIIWPKDLKSTYEFSDINDSSIGLIIEYGNLTIYSAGDLSSKYELESIKGLNYSDIDILKVSHHGSKTSSSFEFLNIIKPEFSIIQSGKNNKYGHPAKEILDNLEKVNTNVIRNDLEGTIKLSSDGKYIFIGNSNQFKV